MYKFDLRMKTSVLFLLVFFTIESGIAFPQNITDSTVTDYEIIDKMISQKVKKYGSNNVLVVLDIDNTILTSDTDLGSDLWYQWQRNYLDVKPKPEQILSDSCLFDEAIQLLYELGTMSLTDKSLPGYIKKWQESHITVFALTSRSPASRTATERELYRYNIHLENSALKTLDGNRMTLNYELDRKLSYQNGIFMTSGMDKGKMLKHLLGKSGKTFKSIIFVDDTRKNIDNVKNAYAACNEMDMVLFYFTKVMKERLQKNNNQDLTREQADKMDEDWNILLEALLMLFPERAEKCKCVLESNQ